MQRIAEVRKLLQSVNLGATADLTGIKFTLAGDLIEATSDTGDSVLLSGVLKHTSTKLTKICSDLRKHPTVKTWLTEHPRFHFHFTPTGASWLNLVERFFAEITRKRIRRGTFHSVPALIAAIRRYVREHNKDARPFI